MEIFSQILWAALPGIITGLVLAAWNRRQKIRDDTADQREEERKKSEVVKRDLLVATAELTRAPAVQSNMVIPTVRCLKVCASITKQLNSSGNLSGTS